MSKTIIKKKLTILKKSTKKIKFVLIFEILLQLHLKSRKNLINNNNKNILRKTNNNNRNRIYNKFIKQIISFANSKCNLFINKSISIKTQYSNKTINLELKEQK